MPKKPIRSIAQIAGSGTAPPTSIPPPCVMLEGLLSRLKKDVPPAGMPPPTLKTMSPDVPVPLMLANVLFGPS